MTMKLLVRTVAALSLLAPVSAFGDPKQASQAHIAKAMEAHGQNNFELALAELEMAYKLDPVPDLLYAIAQVQVQLDRCGDAIGNYERYLATNPAPQAAADTRQAIAVCKTKVEPAPAPAPDPGPATAPPMATPALPPEPPPEGSRWYQDKLGGVLVIAGVGATIAGAVVYGGARSDLDDAEGASDLDTYRQLVDDARSKRTLSVVLFAGGGALIAAGVVRYVISGGERREARVGVVPARGGGLVTWGGQF